MVKKTNPSVASKPQPEYNPERPSPDDGGQASPAELPKDEERDLTAGEKAMLQKYFKGSLDYGKVKVKHGKFFFGQPDGTAMTPNGKVNMPGAIYRDDYSKLGVGGRALLVHELTHAWQHQQNVVPDLRITGTMNAFNYQRTGPKTGQKGMYLYDYSYHYKDDGVRDLVEYGYEQQASIIEDYYRMINGQHCVHCGSQMTLDDYDNPEHGLLRNFLANPYYAKGRDYDPGVKE